MNEWSNRMKVCQQVISIWLKKHFILDDTNIFSPPNLPEGQKMGVHLPTLMDGTAEEKTKICIFYI